MIEFINYVQNLRDREEQLNVQLAGCSVAALGYAEVENDAKKGDWGHSVAFNDVKALYQKKELYRKALSSIDLFLKIVDKDDDYDHRDNLIGKEAICIAGYSSTIVVGMSEDYPELYEYLKNENPL